MTSSQTRATASLTNPPVRRSNKISGNRRTLKILQFTSVAYFTLWSPYVAVVMLESFVSSFQPPAAVEFAVMWLANANSAVNVFVYSATNTQFRRQCVLLASRLCCSRLSSEERTAPSRPGASTTLPVINMSTLNAQSTAPSDPDIPSVVVTSSRDLDAVSRAELFGEPHTELLITVDNSTQSVNIESLASNEHDVTEQAFNGRSIDV